MIAKGAGNKADYAYVSHTWTLYHIVSSKSVN